VLLELAAIVLILTLLGLGLIKINNVSANFNNPRPSLLLKITNGMEAKVLTYVIYNDSLYFVSNSCFVKYLCKVLF
jgi:hypothetical protein